MKPNQKGRLEKNITEDSFLADYLAVRHLFLSNAKCVTWSIDKGMEIALFNVHTREFKITTHFVNGEQIVKTVRDDGTALLDGREVNKHLARKWLQLICDMYDREGFV